MFRKSVVLGGAVLTSLLIIVGILVYVKVDTGKYAVVTGVQHASRITKPVDVPITKPIVRTEEPVITEASSEVEFSVVAEDDPEALAAELEYQKTHQEFMDTYNKNIQMIDDTLALADDAIARIDSVLAESEAVQAKSLFYGSDFLRYYNELRDRGLTHEEAMNDPECKRLADAEMERHLQQ